MKKTMKKNKKTIGKLITVLTPLLTILLLPLKKYIPVLLHQLPVCPFYKRFDLYCPGCGNTRSIIAFLNGDIFSSLRYNIEPVLLLSFGICGYIELASYSFGHPVRILPRNDKFYFISALLLVLYFIVRNFFPYLTP